YRLYSPAFQSDPRHLGSQPDACSPLSGLRGKAGHHAVRVYKTIGRTVAASEDIVGANLWQNFHYLFATDNLYALYSLLELKLAMCSKIFQMRLGTCDEQVANRPAHPGTPRYISNSPESGIRVVRHVDVYASSSVRTNAGETPARRTRPLPPLPVIAGTSNAHGFLHSICAGGAGEISAYDDYAG